MKKESPEYYWESIKEKSEKGDFMGAGKDFRKLMESDSDYKEYCYHKRDEEGSKFLVPMIDYYWWKEKIKGKDELKSYTEHTVTEVYMGGFKSNREPTVSTVYKLEKLYDYDKIICEATVDFVEKHHVDSYIITFNQFTYSQLCYIISISPKRELSNIGDDVEVAFEEIVVFAEPTNDEDEVPEINDESDEPEEIEPDSDDLPEIDNNYVATQQLWICLNENCNVSTILNVTFNEDLKDKEFELKYIEPDEDDDDDDDDFDDNIPDLPEGGLVKKKEVVFDLE